MQIYVQLIFLHHPTTAKLHSVQRLPYTPCKTQHSQRHSHSKLLLRNSSIEVIIETNPTEFDKDEEGGKERRGVGDGEEEEQQQEDDDEEEREGGGGEEEEEEQEQEREEQDSEGGDARLEFKKLSGKLNKDFSS